MKPFFVIFVKASRPIMPGKRPRSPALSQSHPHDTAPLLTPILLVPFLVGAEVMTVPWALLTSRAGGGPTSLLCRSAAAVLPLLCGGATHTLTPPSSDIYDAEESTQSSSSSAEQLLPLVPTGSRSTPFAIAVDCDHHVFRCLLRLLRGYTSGVPEELRTTCCLEAHRLGLSEVWERRYPPTPVYTFCGGGGTSEQQRVFTSYVVLSRVGPWLPIAKRTLPVEACTYTVTFRVELCDFVGVGVISHHVTDFGADCRGVKGTAIYNANGDVHSTPLTPPPPSPTPLSVGRSCLTRAASYAAEAVITVTLDVARGIVLWDRAGHPTVVALLWEYPPQNSSGVAEVLSGASLAFAVVCSGKSAVRIVE